MPRCGKQRIARTCLLRELACITDGGVASNHSACLIRLYCRLNGFAPLWGQVCSLKIVGEMPLYPQKEGNNVMRTHFSTMALATGALILTASTAGATPPTTGSAPKAVLAGEQPAVVTPPAD